MLEPKVFSDERGYLLETYNEKSFGAAGITERFVQDNCSHSRQHVLRGLHFQSEKPQGKLIRVIQGEIFDVAVDVRPGSANYGRWMGINLTGEKHQLLWVPPGFAHGYYVLTETADIMYKVSDFYHPASERTLLWNDPDLAIQWPLRGEPILSGKDKSGSRLRQL